MAYCVRRHEVSWWHICVGRHEVSWWDIVLGGMR